MASVLHDAVAAVERVEGDPRYRQWYAEHARAERIAGMELAMLALSFEAATPKGGE